MKNLKDSKTEIYPSTTRGGKELPSSSALDSPSVMSKFATSPPARNLDMSPVLDDATSAIHDAYDDALLDTALHWVHFLLHNFLELLLSVMILLKLMKLLK